MRAGMAAAAMLGFVSLATGDGESVEGLVKEYLKNTREAITVLSAIKSQATAESARARLNDVSLRLAEFEKKRRILDKASEKTMEELQKKYSKQLKTLDEELTRQFTRLEKLPASWPVFANTVFQGPILARYEDARQQVAQLSEAVRTYQVNYKEYPPTLDALTKKQGKDDPLLDAKALLDPWGNHYLYDVKGPRNQGKMPDLWSTGPTPGQPASLIGNWMDAPLQEDKK